MLPLYHNITITQVYVDKQYKSTYKILTQIVGKANTKPVIMCHVIKHVCSVINNKQYLRNAKMTLHVL